MLTTIIIPTLVTTIIIAALVPFVSITATVVVPAIAVVASIGHTNVQRTFQAEADERVAALRARRSIRDPHDIGNPHIQAP